MATERGLLGKCRHCGAEGLGRWVWVGGVGSVYECDDVEYCRLPADYKRGFEAGVAHAQETVGLWYVARPVGY